MSVQTSYNFFGAYGAPGGIYDLAPLQIDTYANEENDGVMKPGFAVVVGTAANQCKKPISTSTIANFLGVATANRTTEYNTSAVLNVRKNQAIGVMKYGKILVRLATSVSPTVGAAAYVVKSGDDAGCFTTSSDSTIAVNARFVTTADNGVAAIELLAKPVIDAN